MIIDEEFKVIFLHNPKCGGRFFKDMCKKNRNKNIRIFEGFHSEETNVDLGHISLINLPRFVPDYQEYRIIAFVRNPYNRFVSAVNHIRIMRRHNDLKKMLELNDFNPQKICSHILTLNYYEQDKILRNQKYPLLMSQSYFTGANIITLRYEMLADWRFLFSVFKIPDATVCIKEDYALDDETKAMIRELYFDDEEIFRMYDKNN